LAIRRKASHLLISPEFAKPHQAGAAEYSLTKAVVRNTIAAERLEAYHKLAVFGDRKECVHSLLWLRQCV